MLWPWPALPPTTNGVACCDTADNVLDVLCAGQPYARSPSHTNEVLDIIQDHANKAVELTRYPIQSRPVRPFLLILALLTMPARQSS